MHLLAITYRPSLDPHPAFLSNFPEITHGTLLIFDEPILMASATTDTPIPLDGSHRLVTHLQVPLIIQCACQLLVSGCLLEEHAATVSNRVHDPEIVVFPRISSSSPSIHLLLLNFYRFELTIDRVILVTG